MSRVFRVGSGSRGSTHQLFNPLYFLSSCRFTDYSMVFSVQCRNPLSTSLCLNMRSLLLKHHDVIVRATSASGPKLSPITPAGQRRHCIQLNLTPGQVQYALSHRVTPQKKKSGRRPLLSPAERKQLVEWVCTWTDIPGILGWKCSVYAIETAFKHEGFARRTALKEPLLAEAHRKARLAWSEEHINRTWEDWKWVFLAGRNVGEPWEA